MFDFDPNDFRLEDLDRVARQSERALQGLTEAMTELANVVGEGKGADGLIQVTMDSTGRVTDVTVNPRMMRTNSATIAEGMTEAFNAAQDDLAAKSRLLLSGGLPEGVDEQDVTQDKMRSRFDEILESFNRAMGERNATLDELRRDAEGNG
jgi:DNA-binding protein YbaB